jgi:hypothetical protein
VSGGPTEPAFQRGPEAAGRELELWQAEEREQAREKEPAQEREQAQEQAREQGQVQKEVRLL